MSGTVLIVDDDPGIREMARLVLTREGYGVLMAADGQTAMEVMATDQGAGNVCAILCDLEMPGGGGRELIQRLRLSFPDIPVLVMSGAPDTVFLDGIVEEGVCDWLRKPVTRQEMVQKVRTAGNLFVLRHKGK